MQCPICGNEMKAGKISARASSDYLQTGSGYQSLARNRNEQYSKEYLRDILQEY